MEGFVAEENLEPFVALVAFLTGYDLYSESYDYVGIQYGLQDTDVDKGRWYAYPLTGSIPVLLEVASEPGAREQVHVRVTSSTVLSAELTAQLDLLESICFKYILTRRQ